LTTLSASLQSGTTPSTLLPTSRSSLCRINTKQLASNPDTWIPLSEGSLRNS
jgi:hypothetical protein